MVAQRNFYLIISSTLISYFCNGYPLETQSNSVLVSWTLLSQSDSNDTVRYRMSGNLSIPLIPEPQEWSGQLVFDPNRKRMILFGGSTGMGKFLNDLWQWNVTAQEWDWIGGSLEVNNLGYAAGMGIPDIQNVPSARIQHALTINPETGAVFLFGGYACGPNSEFGEINDFWKWDPVTTIWIWISSISQMGIYGEFGVGNVANTPGPRFMPFMFYSVNTASVILTFGEGLDSVGGYGTLTDVWSYNEASHWNWIGGSKFANTPGSEEQPAPGYLVAAMDAEKDCLYVIEAGYNSLQNRLWLFDIMKKTWKYLGPKSDVSTIESGLWPEFRSYTALTVLDGVLFFYGGWNSDVRMSFNDIWYWQHKTGTWIYIQENSSDLLSVPVLESEHLDQMISTMVANPASQTTLVMTYQTEAPYEGNYRSNYLWELKFGCDYGHEWIDEECQACPQGKSKNTSVDMNSCKTCNLGMFQSLSGQRICFPCPDPTRARCNATAFECYPGWTADGTKRDCVRCPYNSWKPEFGNHPCYICPSEAALCKGGVLTCQPGWKLDDIKCVPDPQLTWWQANTDKGLILIFFAALYLSIIGFIAGFAEIEIVRYTRQLLNMPIEENSMTQSSVSTTESTQSTQYSNTNVTGSEIFISSGCTLHEGTDTYSTHNSESPSQKIRPLGEIQIS